MWVPLLPFRFSGQAPLAIQRTAVLLHNLGSACLPEVARHVRRSSSPSDHWRSTRDSASEELHENRLWSATLRGVSSSPFFELPSRYGQTECGAAGTLNLPFDTSPDYVGAPAPWAQVRDVFRDKESQVKLIDVPEMGYLASEDRGEVLFRGAAVMSGYFEDEELSRKTVDDEV